MKVTRAGTRSFKPFSTIRNTTLPRINGFIEDSWLYCNEGRTAYSMQNSEGKKGLSGYFNDGGLEGILEAKDMKI